MDQGKAFPPIDNSSGKERVTTLTTSKYIAYVWYANGALIYNEFLAHTSNPEGQIYDCQEQGGIQNPACKPYTGTYIVKSLGFPFNSLWKPAVILVGFILVFFFGSAAILKLRPAPSSISKFRPKEKEDQSTVQESKPASVLGSRTVSITLEGYSLAVQKRDLIRRKRDNVTILRQINTTFESGILNVIMGPSGSGKTSLNPS